MVYFVPSSRSIAVTRIGARRAVLRAEASRAAKGAITADDRRDARHARSRTAKVGLDGAGHIAAIAGHHVAVIAGLADADQAIATTRNGAKIRHLKACVKPRRIERRSARIRPVRNACAIDATEARSAIDGRSARNRRRAVAT